MLEPMTQHDIIKFRVNTLLVKILIGLIMALGATCGFIISDFYNTISDLKAENNEYDKSLADIRIEMMHLSDVLEYVTTKHDKWGDK